MSDMQGAFIWYELMTTDAAGSKAFYDNVMGWNVAPSGDEAMDYREIVAADGEAVGGMLPLSPEMRAQGAQPGWFGYVAVDDVDAEIAAIKAAGGMLFMDQTMEGVGRMAMVADAHGVAFYVMDPRPPAELAGQPSTAFAPDREGHVTWNEMMTPDPEAATRFYADRFGWTVGGEMPMGELGTYAFLNHGDAQIGALMPLPPGASPRWTFYWRTADIDAAKARIEAAGGTITNGPIQVPGDEWVIEATDPLGVPFGMAGPRD